LTSPTRMVFGVVPRPLKGSFRAFGPPRGSKEQLREQLHIAFNKARQYHWRERQVHYGRGPPSFKQLRNCFSDALQLNVIFQPVTIPCKQAKSGLTDNPLWDHAPAKAYYKAKRLSSLLTLLASVGHLSEKKISRDLLRLSTQVWTLHLKNFDGLTRRIRAICCAGFRKFSETNPKSPEASKRGNAYGKSGVFRLRVNWCTRHQKYRFLKPEYIAMRYSNKVGVVSYSLKLLERARLAVGHDDSPGNGFGSCEVFTTNTHDPR
jgi:hypothetical protein